MRLIDFPLPQHRETTRFIMEATPDTKSLLVFCHGWHGDLVKTWGDLLAIKRRHSTLDGHDLLFLGYRRSPASIDLLASWIADCLKGILPDFTMASRSRSSFSKRYRSVVLVGHSMGTLALRRAVLRLHTDRHASKNARFICANGRLVLFAPPLNGVDWSKYLKIIGVDILERIVRLVLAAREKVADQLQTGSDFLNQLRETTSASLRSDPDSFPHAHLVLAMHDAVIEVDSLDDFAYPTDMHVVEEDATHVSVCKYALADPNSSIIRVLTEPPAGAS